MPRKRLPAKLHLLSVRAVQTAGDGDHSDGGGLTLRVAGAAAAWVFRYTAATGKRREMGLGAVHRANPQQAGHSLTSARELAGKARLQLQEGIDPIDARDSLRTAQREAAEQEKAGRKLQALTLARAARDYHERVIEPTKSTKHGQDWINSLENHIPADLWHAPVASITAPALLAALQAVRPHERARRLTQADRLPETVSRIRQRLDAIFEDAVFHGWCGTNPAAAVKRKLREGMLRCAQGRLAALPYAEAPAFMQRLRGMEGVAARALELGMLTAARTGELLQAEWGEFDLEQLVWTVPAEKMKAGEPHTVHLSPCAVELLRGLRGLHARWLFPSPMPSQRDRPISNMAMLKVLDRMGMRDRTTVHGLCRATFSTWANETGAARPDVVEACLAHQEENHVRRAYNRAQFTLERRALLERWAEYLNASNVVQLQRAA